VTLSSSGWTFEGLGAYFLFPFILPLNGILLGLGIAPILWHRLAKHPLHRATYIGLGVQLALLAVNLIVLAQFEIYMGNFVGFRRG
jgi:hypothetical protein